MSWTLEESGPIEHTFDFVLKRLVYRKDMQSAILAIRYAALYGIWNAGVPKVVADRVSVACSVAYWDGHLKPSFWSKKYAPVIVNVNASALFPWNTI